jgi:seryl-tRNA synthetase
MIARNECKEAVFEKEQLIGTQSQLMKEVARNARLRERQHLSKAILKHKSKTSEISNKFASLLNRTIDAEKTAKSAVFQSNQSTKQSKEIAMQFESQGRVVLQYKQQLAIQHDEIIALEEKLDTVLKELNEANAAVPIKVFGKVREGNRGNLRWPLYVWELILEQIVNGTPPSCINNNIVTMIKIFSPTTQIRELPSIWTILRARTVLLVIVQTLATYRIAKADKWEQLFTDGTSRRQVAFQNLVVSIEEDDLFK